LCLVCCFDEFSSIRYVKSEVTYAIEEGKKVIPLLLHEGKLSFLFSSLQRISFINDYQSGLQVLLKALKIGKAAVSEPVRKEYRSSENKSESGKVTWFALKILCMYLTNQQKIISAPLSSL
jgi:hypothetical protein